MTSKEMRRTKKKHTKLFRFIWILTRCVHFWWKTINFFVFYFLNILSLLLLLSHEIKCGTFYLIHSIIIIIIIIGLFIESFYFILFYFCSSLIWLSILSVFRLCYYCIRCSQLPVFYVSKFCDRGRLAFWYWLLTLFFSFLFSFVSC